MSQNGSYSFSISTLACAYQHGEVVLVVDRLELPPAGLVFVIGPSGIGKSTLLETLALMNNTIRNPLEAKIAFRPGDGSREIHFAKVWSDTEDYRAALRRQHFSFLFQQTNLMPHFTAGENMCVAQLIQGIPFDQAKARVIEMMGRLGLDASLFDRKTSELSGGQRQRIAFVRAITGQFSILFGDEPTGNLDSASARRLMSIVREQMSAQQGRAAIIVSHDLALAAQFADVIVPIVARTADESRVARQGYIHQDVVLTRTSNGWLDGKGHAVTDIDACLIDYVHRDASVEFML